MSPTIPLILDNPRTTSSPQPVMVGVPAPPGMIRTDTTLVVSDDQGSVLPTQTAPLAHWPDGSVRWLLLDFLAPALASGRHNWTLTVSAITDAQPLIEDSPLNSWDWRLTGRGAGGQVRSREFSRSETITSGPVRCTAEQIIPGVLRAEEERVRRHHYRGTGLVRLDVTTANPWRARHAGGLWDLGDPSSILFRELAFELVLSEATPSVTSVVAPRNPPLSHAIGHLDLRQTNSGRKGGPRLNPVVTASTSRGAATVAVPEFWQNFPKSVTVEGNLLRVGLFPEEPGNLHELQGGEQKTHSIWFHLGEVSSPDHLCWVHEPLRVRVPPEWHECYGVLPGLLTTRCQPDGAFAELLAAAVDPKTGLVARREVIDEYGWRNYGDVYADHEAAHRPLVSHYNNQYDLLLGCLLHYLRTGDARWWEIADPLARHVIDIDVYHTHRDRAAYNGGLFWHTDHYKDAATATHRAYSRANAVPGKPYGGGPGNEHNYTTGLLLYYYLTGYEPAREAVVGLADWVINMDDGRRTVFGLFDDGPTGLASRTRSDDYHGPGRGAGNSINALLDGWLLTGQCHYLDKAESLVHRCVHPTDDVAARDLLNVEERWSYTVFFSVLARYLDLKAEAGQLDLMYTYARASLLHYADWMLEHERPYFDRPEQLEFPTETWAAQELRKANVLRLASRHADEVNRTRLSARGMELADRAWADLMRFPSRATTRPLAIVLIEGMKDCVFRQTPPPPLPPPAQAFNLPPPEVFVPQRRRVITQLRRPQGFGRVMLRMLTSPFRRRQTAVTPGRAGPRPGDDTGEKGS